MFGFLFNKNKSDDQQSLNQEELQVEDENTITQENSDNGDNNTSTGMFSTRELSDIHQEPLPEPHEHYLENTQDDELNDTTHNHQDNEYSESIPDDEYLDELGENIEENDRESTGESYDSHHDDIEEDYSEEEQQEYDNQVQESENEVFHNDVEVPEEVGEDVDSWFDDNQTQEENIVGYPEGYDEENVEVAENVDVIHSNDEPVMILRRVIREEEIVINEEEKGGWYDPESLLDIDETTTDSEFEQLDDNTSTDNLNPESLPDDELYAMETIPIYREPIVTEKTSTVMLVNNDDSTTDITELVGENKYYLVDISDNKNFEENLHLEQSQRQYLDTAGKDSSILDLPHLISDKKSDTGEEIVVIVYGADEALEKIDDAFGKGSIAHEVIINRCQKLVKQAYDNNISVFIIPSHDGHELSDYLDMILG